MCVREKYRILSRQELLAKVYQPGADFEKNSGSCSQYTVAALCEVLGFEKALVKG
jgi:hypothetical protein